MSFSSLDRSFARYRKSGDPSALAFVFDRTAHELLRVAVHLVGDLHRAEDLVQQTFVCVIENRQKYDPGQRVLPWLLGILGNRIRHLRRQESRRRTARLPPIVGPEDPADASATLEIRSLVEAALRSLPQPYRQVLTLHLQHGLQAVEIHAVLDRPAGTVRTQIARGMEMLRRSLPRGAAVGLASIVPTGSGIARLRRIVLTRAGADVAALASAAGVTSGVVMAKMSHVAAVAAVSVGLLGWWVWTRVDEVERPALRVQDMSAGDTASAEASPMGSPTPVSGEGSGLRKVLEAGPAVPGAVAVTLRHADGEPAGGVELRWRSDPDGTAAGPWEAERTDAAGQLEVPALEPGSWTFDVSRFSDRTPVQETVEVVSGVQTRIELELPAGLQVRGRVLDADGDLVPGAAVWGDCGPDAFAGMALARTGTDGSFALRDLPAGARIWARKPGYQPSREEMLFGAAGAGIEAVLQLGAEAVSVSGLVLDAAGRPATADVAVFMDADAVWGGWEGGRRLGTRSRADGQFYFDEVPVGSHVFVAELATGDGPRRAATRVDIAQGSPPVELRIGEGAVVTGFVMDAGKPVAGAVVRATCRMANLSRPFYQLYRGQAASGDDGAYRIAGLLPGAYILEVAAGGSRIRAGVELAEGEERRWDPVMELRGELHLQLVGSDGAPVPGWRVALRKPGGFEELGSQTTAASGALHFRALRPGTVQAAVYPPRPGQTSDREHVVFPVMVQDLETGGREQVLTLPEGAGSLARIVGRAVTVGGSPIPSAQVQLGRRGWPVYWNEYGDATTGSFAIEDLPAGTYSLVVRPTGYPVRSFGSLDIAPGQVLDLGNVVFEPPGNVIVKSWTDPAATAWLEGKGGRRYPFQIVDATLQSGPVPPGDYTLCSLSPGSVPSFRPLSVFPGDQALVIEPESAAASLRLSFQVPEHETRASHCDLIVDVYDEQGRPYFHERIFAGFDDPALRSVRRQRGVAPGRYRVTVRDRELPFAAEVDVEVGVGDSPRLELVLR